MPGVYLPAFTWVTWRTLRKVFARLRSMSFCNERTFLQSPAWVARKIRCLTLRAARWTFRQLTASQSVGLSGPFASPWARIQLTLRLATVTTPFGWFTWPPSAALRRGQPPYPPGYGFPLPFGRWRSLPGPSLSRCGAGPALRLAYCPGLRGRPQRGYHVPHRVGAKGEGAWSTPGPGCPTRRRLGSSCPVAHHCRLSQPSSGNRMNDGASTQVQSRSPVPSFPRPFGPDGSGRPWACPLASHPLVTEDARRGGNRPWTLVGVLRPLHRSDFVSHPAIPPRSSLALRVSPSQAHQPSQARRRAKGLGCSVRRKVAEPTVRGEMGVALVPQITHLQTSP